jgi:hypothetical protein
MTSLQKPNTYKKLGVAIVVLLISFTIARWLYFPHTPEGQRRSIIKATAAHAKAVTPLLARDIRFADIRVSEWWKDEGYFLVRGSVENESSLADLKRLIISTHPPTPVVWQVEIVKRGSPTNITTNAP